MDGRYAGLILKAAVGSTVVLNDEGGFARLRALHTYTNSSKAMEAPSPLRGSQLEYAGIASRPFRISFAEVIEHLGYDVFIGKEGQGQPAMVKGPLLAIGDDAFRQATDLFGLGLRSSDTLIEQQISDKATIEGLALTSVAVELPSSDSMPHNCSSWLSGASPSGSSSSSTVVRCSSAGRSPLPEPFWDFISSGRYPKSSSFV